MVCAAFGKFQERDSGRCQYILNTFKGLAMKLALPLAEETTEGPATVLTFLGIEIDTVQQTSRLPLEKPEALKARIGSLLEKSKMTLRELQRIVGHLNFACRVVAPGRAFIRRISAAMAGLKRPLYRTRVTRSVKEDLKVWMQFLTGFHGIFFLEVQKKCTGRISNSVRCGRSLRLWHLSSRKVVRRFMAGGMAQRRYNKRPYIFRILPHCGALWMWAEEWADSVVRFWCDNKAVVCIINSLTSQSEWIMGLVRAFTLTSLQYNNLVHARHIPGLDNSIVDTLSHQQMDRFRQLAPEARELPKILLPEVWQICVMTHPKQ